AQRCGQVEALERLWAQRVDRAAGIGQAVACQLAYLANCAARQVRRVAECGLGAAQLEQDGGEGLAQAIMDLARQALALLLRGGACGVLGVPGALQRQAEPLGQRSRLLDLRWQKGAGILGHQLEEAQQLCASQQWQGQPNSVALEAKLRDASWAE